MGPALHLHPTHSQGQWASLPGELGRNRLQQRGTRPSRSFLGWLSSAFQDPSLSGLQIQTALGANFPGLLGLSGFHQETQNQEETYIEWLTDCRKLVYARVGAGSGGLESTRQAIRKGRPDSHPISLITMPLAI